MIIINLLSPDKKKDLKLMRLYYTLKNFIIFILLFTIVVAIVLLLSKTVLQNYFNMVVAQNNLTTKSNSIFNQNIKVFNKYLTAVEKIQKEYIAWTALLIDFTKLVPDGITLYNLNLETSNGKNQVVISGVASTRVKLLEFKTNLDNSGWLADVNIPLESLLEKENINFTVKANFKIK